MLQVSEGWKNAHGEMLLPETFIEIDYKISEPGLQEQVSMNVSQPADISSLPDALRTGKKQNSLEWNAWGLDGTFDYSDAQTVPGYVSEGMCDDQGRFSNLPTITLNFNEVHSTLIPGLSIWWSNTYDEWASSFRIIVYNGSEVVAETLVEDNKSYNSTVWLEYQNFDKIVIEVLEWCLPYRRCRTMYVFVGVVAVYTKGNLLSFIHNRNVDLLSAALSKSEIIFSLDNSDDQWDPTNPTGAERYLMERQKVTLRYGMMVNGEIEWLDSGTFWLSEWNTPSNGLEASFTARDAIQFMEDEYTGPRSGTLYEIAEAALGQISLDGEAVEYEITNHLTTIETEITATVTVAEVLQMAAHAAGCVFYCDVAGVVHIEQRNTQLTDYVIDSNVSYTYPEFTLSKPLKAVSVSYGEDQSVTVTAGNVGEVQTVTNDLIITAVDAEDVANVTKDVLINRKTISGDYRADPRVEPLDVITVHNKYSPSKVAITDLSFTTTGGALRGNYVGRVIDDG